MTAKANVDALRDWKNYFFIGNYQKCLIESYKLEDDSMEKRIFTYRACIALNKTNVVLEEIKPDEQSPLIVLRYMAEYYSDTENRKEIIKRLDNKFKSDLASYGSLWLVIAATIYFNEGHFDSALKILNGSQYCECLALRILCLLQINRPHVAKKIYKVMAKINENKILTTLSKVWLYIDAGGKKINEAYLILKDLCKQYGQTSHLVNNMAVCLIDQKKYFEAKLLLSDCMTKDPHNREIRMNLMVVARHLGETLETMYPVHKESDDESEPYHLRVYFK